MRVVYINPKNKGATSMPKKKGKKKKAGKKKKKSGKKKRTISKKQLAACKRNLKKARSAKKKKAKGRTTKKKSKKTTKKRAATKKKNKGSKRKGSKKKKKKNSWPNAKKKHSDAAKLGWRRKKRKGGKKKKKATKKRKTGKSKTGKKKKKGGKRTRRNPKFTFPKFFGMQKLNPYVVPFDKKEVKKQPIAHLGGGVLGLVASGLGGGVTRALVTGATKMEPVGDVASFVGNVAATEIGAVITNAIIGKGLKKQTLATPIARGFRYGGYIGLVFNLIGTAIKYLLKRSEIKELALNGQLPAKVSWKVGDYGGAVKNLTMRGLGLGAIPEVYLAIEGEEPDDLFYDRIDGLGDIYDAASYDLEGDDDYDDDYDDDLMGEDDELSSIEDEISKLKALMSGGDLGDDGYDEADYMEEAGLA